MSQRPNQSVVLQIVNYQQEFGDNNRATLLTPKLPTIYIPGAVQNDKSIGNIAQKVLHHFRATAKIKSEFTLSGHQVDIVCYKLKGDLDINISSISLVLSFLLRFLFPALYSFSFPKMHTQFSLKE
uniref:Uncharacterized protein n=1 Tax=Glossina palpalis gambiensis TaxID=67801 RepID=A0A1B0BNQ7_9MUSC